MRLEKSFTCLILALLLVVVSLPLMGQSTGGITGPATKLWSNAVTQLLHVRNSGRQDCFCLGTKSWGLV